MRLVSKKLQSRWLLLFTTWRLHHNAIYRVFFLQLPSATLDTVTHFKCTSPSLLPLDMQNTIFILAWLGSSWRKLLKSDVQLLCYSVPLILRIPIYFKNRNFPFASKLKKRIRAVKTAFSFIYTSTLLIPERQEEHLMRWQLQGQDSQSW